MRWITISCILCAFGCFKEFRPSESFVTDYLTGPWKNFTHIQVNQEIFPVSTYAYFATLIIIFLITDLVRYKPIIILCGISGSVTFLLLALSRDLLIMQIMEFCYGLFMSTEVAYYTYIYAKVDRKHYQEVTSHTKAASLFGRCMSGIIAQLTTSLELLNYHHLTFITASAIIFATIWAFFLPSVGQSIYFHKEAKNRTSYINDGILQSQRIASESSTTIIKQVEYNSANPSVSIVHKIKQAYILLWRDFLEAYANGHVVKWSIWWSFSTCGYLQVISYIQLLWQTAVSQEDQIYNGAVDFLYAIISTIIIFCIGKISYNWSLIGDITVSFMSLIEGILLLISSYSYNIWFLYTGYIIFGVIYHTMVTVASFEVAKNISEDSYGLIFGLNTFLALLLQSILTAIVVNGNLGLNLRSQYFIYGSYFIVISVLFTVIGIINIMRRIKSGEKFRIWIKPESTAIDDQYQEEEKPSKSCSLS